MLSAYYRTYRTEFRQTPVVLLQDGEVVERFDSLEHLAASHGTVPKWVIGNVEGRWAITAADRWIRDELQLRFENGAEVSCRQLRVVYGSRFEDEHPSFRGHGPVPGIHKISGHYAYFRRPQTFSIKRDAEVIDKEAGEIAPRRKRSVVSICDDWDDKGRSDYFNRNWKHRRSTQWK